MGLSLGFDLGFTWVKPNFFYQGANTKTNATTNFLYNFLQFAKQNN